MNSPEGYIQFKPDMITADGDVTIKATEDFLCNYMEELPAFIVRVMTVLPRAGRQRRAAGSCSGWPMKA